MDVEEPAAAEPGPGGAGGGLSAAEVEKMTVAKLKEALEERDLSTKGLKAVLKKRLLDTL